MKYALLANLSFDTSTKRDAVYTKIETFLSGKPVWGNSLLSKGTDFETGNPNILVTVRFNQQLDLNNIFDLVKIELNKLTGVKATFSKHVCYHDETPRSCVIEELATVIR